MDGHGSPDADPEDEAVFASASAAVSARFDAQCYCIFAHISVQSVFHLWLQNPLQLEPNPVALIRTESVLSPAFAQAKSSVPSQLTSATMTVRGALPASSGPAMVSPVPS
jgi:hypothetical protein